ncbi:MAG TPA: TonB-dependent receptor plug domain-containing protein [Vicinamibacterales bacterium]
MALLGGVTVAPGGDAGPAGGVPGLLGSREADDLLLLVDGIPAGGAFIPQIEAISLNNVERIELLRGAAPSISAPPHLPARLTSFTIPPAAPTRRPRTFHHRYTAVTMLLPSACYRRPPDDPFGVGERRGG